MKSIITGAKPSEVFRSILKESPELSNYDLATLFVNAFPKVQATAKNVIWYWRGPARPEGYLDDDQMDAELLTKLKGSGYL